MHDFLVYRRADARGEGEPCLRILDAPEKSRRTGIADPFIRNLIQFRCRHAGTDVVLNVAKYFVNQPAGVAH